MVLSLILMTELGFLFYNSGIVTGINEKADHLKQYALATRDDETILPGDIFDRNGNCLVKTSVETIVEKDEEGNEKEKKEKVTSYSNGKAYSQVIGYTGPRKLLFDGATDEVIIGRRNDYRLMAFLDDSTYWGDNGLYKNVGKSGRKGQNAFLTLDSNLQEKVYEILLEEMSDSSAQGSAVVMDVKTGEILSMVSFPTYDFNDLKKAKQQMNEDEEKTALEPGYPVSHKASKTPGSIFKVLTAVSLIDHGMEDFLVEDTSFEVDGWRCDNAYTSQGDTIGYYQGMERSSNVFYAKAAIALGADRLNETMAKFMMVPDSDGDKNDDTSLLLDFGTVEYNYQLFGTDSDAVLGQTGFGQGKTEFSTVYAAMISGAIANDGVMMQPWLVKKMVDANGAIVYLGEGKILSEATGKETADKVTESMKAAVAYTVSHHKELQEYAEIFDKYEVAGKTGTAQVGDVKELTNDTNAWFLSFAPAQDPQYAVVVNQCRSGQKAGYQMMPAAAKIYEYLFEQS